MNDTDVLTEVKHTLVGARDSLGNPRMSLPAEAIITRARERRRGHRLMAGAAAALVAVAGTGLALASLNGGSAGRQVDLKLAAWTIRTQGASELTLTLVETNESAAVSEIPEVRGALAQAGVPAEVTFGSTCTSSASLSIATDQQVIKYISTPSGFGITVVPSAMPPNTKLNISVDPGPAYDNGVVMPPQEGMSWLVGATIVPASAVITCQEDPGTKGTLGASPPAPTLNTPGT